MQDIYHSTDSHANRSISHCRIVVFSVITLCILIFSVYSNSFDCSWHFDDEPNITDNPNLHLKKLTWENLKRTLYSDRNNPTVPYRPVACFTFALNHYFGGLNVFGYHLVNLVIHIISSVFLFLFIYHTLNLPSLRVKYAPQSYFIALLTTTLWAINPIQTQAVTYIVQRMASMAGMLYIMSMYFYLRARTSDTNPRKILLFIACFVSFLMALGSKENAAMLPVSIFLYEILLMQGIGEEKLRRSLRLFGIITAVVLVVCFTYFYVQGGNIFSFLIGYANRPFTLGQRLLTEPLIVVFYVTLLLYPVPNRLSIDQPLPFGIPESLSGPIWAFSCILSMLIIAGFVSYALCSAKKRPLFSFCILFFFVNHAIESTILPLELIFEHRNYIPSMFFFLPIAIGFNSLLQLYAKRRIMSQFISVFIILLLIGLGNATFMRNFTWKNEKTLWIDAVEKGPNQFRPHHNLGRYYQHHGYRNRAISEYEKALTSTVSHRKSEVYITYYNLGKIYGDMSKYKTALDYYYKALHTNPACAPVYNNIAGIFDRYGRHELAYRYLAKSFRLRPDSLETNLNLGFYYLQKKQPDKAIYHLNAVSDAEEFEDRVLLYLGIAFKQKGQLGRAATYFNMAGKKNSRDIKPYLHLGEIFYRKGDYEQAKGAIAKAINLIADNRTFQRILEDLKRQDSLRNLQPQASAIIPLLKECCLNKSETLREWSELLDEKPLPMKARE